MKIIAILASIAALASSPVDCGGSNGQPDGPGNIEAPVVAE